MKKWMTIEQYLHDEDSVCKREPRCIPVYLASEVEEELEKARREGIVEGFNKIPDMAHARADERERIVRQIQTWVGPYPYGSLSEALAILIHQLKGDTIKDVPPQEPKLEHITRTGQLPNHVYNFLDCISDAVNELREEVRNQK